MLLSTTIVAARVDDFLLMPALLFSFERFGPEPGAPAANQRS
jgi:hypothetical protein